MSELRTRKPGNTLMTIGLLIAVVGVLFIGAVISAGGDGGMLWIPAIGLVLAAIGFARRVLAALENKSAPRD
jgi:uncharacterized protein (TIGR03382 family)